MALNKRVLIITFCHRDLPANYGQTLQAYALYSKIKELGYEPLTASYTKRTEGERRWYEERFYFPDLRTRYSKSFQKISRFVSTEMRVVQCYQESDVYRLAALCDRVVFGGDALWRVERDDPTFWGSFLEPWKLKISYAASMVAFRQEDEEIHRRMFSVIGGHLDYISSREDKPLELLRSYSGREDGVRVCDPVFLWKRSFWGKIEQPVRGIREPYILTYLFNDDGKYNEILEAVKEKYPNREIYAIGAGEESSGKTYMDSGTGIGEFLYLVAHCDAFVTNSFHGGAFAILFEKDFYLCERKLPFLRGDLRIKTLLEDYDLKNRFVEGKADVGKLSPINWEVVKERIEEHREKSEEFLRLALCDAQGKKWN